MTGSDIGSGLAGIMTIFLIIGIAVLMFLLGLTFYAGMLYERHHPKIEIHLTTTFNPAARR